MKTGLFFGSFNPLHIGHLIIANYMVEYTDLETVWFVVSPLNPLKENEAIIEGEHRLQMVKETIKNDDRFAVSEVEFSLPKPSYTIHTLNHLRDTYPQRTFELIMGSDGLKTFHKWHRYEDIMGICRRYVYPRPGYEIIHKEDFTNVVFINAPVIDISGTFIREAIKENHDIRYFIPFKVFEYINFYRLYR